MPKTKAQKQEILQGLQDQLQRQKALVFVGYSGLSVQELSELRQSLREADAQLQVAKKTLLDRAFQGQGLEVDTNQYAGQLGVVFAYGDPVEPLKRVFAFAKAHENMGLLGGYMDHNLLDETSVKELALLPGRDALLDRLVGTIAAPVSGFMTVLQGNVKGLLYALTAIQEQRT